MQTQLSGGLEPTEHNGTFELTIDRGNGLLYVLGAVGCWMVLMPVTLLTLPPDVVPIVLWAVILAAAGFVIYRTMIRPNTIVLKFEDGTVSMYRYGKLRKQADAQKLDIGLLRVKGGSSGSEQCDLLKVTVGFPDGEQLRINVSDKRAVFQREEKTASTGMFNTAPAYQVQRLLDYYHLNGVVHFETHYGWYLASD